MRPIRNLVQLTAPPTLLSHLDIEAAAASLAYQKNWIRHFKFERLVNLVGWLVPFGGVARWVKIIVPWWDKPKEKNSLLDVFSDTPVAGFRYVELFRIGHVGITLEVSQFNLICYGVFFIGKLIFFPPFQPFVML